MKIMVQFSIVIPLYNKSQFITQALNSIKNQTYEDYEVIVVDDGSTDDSKKNVMEWIGQLEASDHDKFRIISQKNNGVSIARNNGVLEAHNDYIAFLDADDYWESTHLANLSLLINDFSDRVGIFSNACIQFQNGTIIYPKLSIYDNYFGIVDYFEVSMISNGFIHSSSVCVKKSLLLLNPFPKGMKNFEDVITWARIANRKGFAFSSAKTAVYVIENAEASAYIDFENYLKYEQALLEIPYDYFILKKYALKFFLLHILFARLNMSFNQYVKQSLNVFGKSFIVSMCLVIGIFIPRFVLKYLRNIRKTK